MFGIVIRAAAGFAGAMLYSSILKEVVDNHVLGIIKTELGKSSLLYTSLDGVNQYMPMIIFLTACFLIMYRGVIERRLAGGA